MSRPNAGAIVGLGRQPVHPFPARMAPGIALTAVSGIRRRLRVLDPMMGSGTVVAAARSMGHCAIGLDIDPLAVLISKVWTTAVDKRSTRIVAEQVLLNAKQRARSLSTSDAYPKDADKETRKFVRYWFDPCARRQLTALARAIGRCSDEKSQNVLWCAFSRLIITKQAGASLALDLAHSRPHKYFDKAPLSPFDNFLKAVDRVLQNCLSSTQKKRGPAPNLHVGDARQLLLRDETIDLVLTSPPYLNAIDYLRCSKFSLVWMGANTGYLRLLRSTAVGTEVGEYEGSQNRLSRALISKLKLRHRLSRRKQAVLAHFISDMQSAIAEVSRVLVPGGKAIYVIGENTIKGTYIQNAKIITAIAENAGLKLRKYARRTLPPNRRYLPPPSKRKTTAGLNGRMRREVILYFSKPRRTKRRIRRSK